ncbi:1, 4-beta cellobiohydrolase [Plasmopara halstedii]|uniref:1, 4-beta cellobiohydrolase n=1 Tax=Plasmopara halstedii TaxID=4781 RepID=A0A0P1AYK3_PLAHL|nr:1, 4-beta cellobiohydrolase [Plasmopara halstedii]CEG46935.1 1, 4-beta cellobiohydrolase [Plasmopara halstedii]|eukprot:XP_024583304.1 1, 4-beta cellobiohydrolase [Plasmopara halstedii]
MKRIAWCFLASSIPALEAERLCSLPPVTYPGAKIAYPESKSALEALEEFGIATWYSDRLENGDYAKTARDLVTSCPEDSRLSVVVYGIPQKDCASTESTSGSTVHTTAEYITFLNILTSTIGARKVLYILEPDAIGLMADTTGCGQTAGYMTNLQVAIEILSKNENAVIYLDVGYWSLEYPNTLAIVVNIVKELVTATSNVKGIALNTSNYQAISKLAQLCTEFQTAMDSTELHCIFDTSRNRNGAPENNEWCNVRNGGIGTPPSNETGYSNVDYFLWVKPSGDSDGTCRNHTSDSIPGPNAGVFFNEIFKFHWNQGTLVAELGYPPIGKTRRRLVGSVVSTNFIQDQEFDDQDFTSNQTGNFQDRTRDVDNEKITTLHLSHRSAEALQVGKKDTNDQTTASGTILLVGVVAATVISLATVIGIRREQKKLLNDDKNLPLSALAPLPNFRVQKSTTKHDESSIL